MTITLLLACNKILHTVLLGLQKLFLFSTNQCLTLGALRKFMDGSSRRLNVQGAKRPHVWGDKLGGESSRWRNVQAEGTARRKAKRLWSKRRRVEGMNAQLLKTPVYGR